MKTDLQDIIDAFEAKDYECLGTLEETSSSWYVQFMKDETSYVTRISKKMPLKLKTMTEALYDEDVTKRETRKFVKELNDKLDAMYTDEEWAEKWKNIPADKR